MPIWTSKTIKLLKRIYIRFLVEQQKLGITYFVFILVGAPVHYLHETHPFFPPTFVSVIWILAATFPILAGAYSMTRVRMRANDIVSLSYANELWKVYVPKKPNHDEDDRQIEFERFVNARMKEYYSIAEFSLFSGLASCFTFAVAFVLAHQLNAPLSKELLSVKHWEIEGPKWAIMIGVAFLGAYSGSIVLMLRRYRAFDLSPTTFLQSLAALVAGTMFGGSLTLIYPENITALVAFLAAFLSAINISFLSNEVRRQYAQITGSSLPNDIPSDLPSIVHNGEIVDALRRMSINSIRELSFSDPIRLFFRIPGEFGGVLSMIDEAVLRTEFRSIFPHLEKLHIRRFTHLVLRIGPTYSNGIVVWPTTVPSIVDKGGTSDAAILATCQDLVAAKTHHVLLGIGIVGYRREFL